MISKTLDWSRLVLECAPDDLDQWHKDWSAIDWPATLRQPDWHLITDDDGSYCLVQPVNGDAMTMEAHLIVARDRRGKAGVEIARDMLAWIELNLGARWLIAKTAERKTRFFLHHLGFRKLYRGVYVLRF